MYEEKCRIYNKNLIKHHINLLISLPFFNHWPIWAIIRILPYFFSRKYIKGQSVFNAGEEPNNIFIVMNGEFEVLFKRAIHLYILDLLKT